MYNPFNISQEKLIELMAGYAAWIKSDPKEEAYPQTYREQSKKIKDEFLNVVVLPEMSDDELYDKIFKYSRKLEGPVQIKLGEPRLRGDLSNIRRNLMYIMTTEDSPFVIAQNILDGKYKIEVFAKAFWSPILLAQFPDVLPNWNNKTEKFLKKFGINISTGRLSIAEKYKILSEAFTLLSDLSKGNDFYSINHLMHYGTVIPEGISLIDQLQGNEVTDPVTAMIKTYKTQIRNTKLKDELFKWQLVNKYLGRPDLKAPDFASEIKSLDLGILVYKMAIAVKNHIVTNFAEEYRACFVKLFNENEDLNRRIKEFTGDILIVYKKSEGLHGHQHDERTISTYLTYHNPDKYTFFKDSYYKEYCKMIGIEPKPKGEKYAHYLELISNLRDKYIIQDTELISLVNGCMTSDCFADNNHLIMAQDILYQIFDKGYEEPEVEEPEEEEFEDVEIIDKDMENNNIQLNTILYGPPGTGKTFHSISHAVAIIDNEDVNDVIARCETNRESVKNRFDKLVEKGQIVFCTFHQNMNYEDFIEGIKPFTSDTEEEQLIYEVEDGIFKRICTEAAFSFIRQNKTTETEKVLDFSSEYDRFIDSAFSSDEQMKISLRNGGIINVVSISQNKNIVVRHSTGNLNYIVSKKRLSKISQAFPNLYDVTNINDQFGAVIGGSNASAYWAVLNAIRNQKPEISPEPKKPLLESANSYELRKDLVESLKKDDYRIENSKRYVLIIDEINRGNVSQIFGELITLIEEDKRLGHKEALTATLPYSKESFGVPGNVHIIGTMNTADRSVEALDAALRRRFSFIHTIPEEAKLETTADGIDLSKLLLKINSRLKILKDMDHTIGHAWLWNVKDVNGLRVVFGAKILPLLEEYFYHDYEKLGLVLGDPFFKEKIQVSSANFAQFSGGNGLANQYDQSWIFELKATTDLTIDDFQSLYA